MRTNVAAITVAAVMLASAASAQEKKVVTVGPEYAAGGAQRFWLGDGYRDLWTTPVELPVLDLAKEAGGLTPVRQVGQAQSVGLAMKGADGRSYTFRSLHKEPERMLPEVLRTTIVGNIAKDLTSGTHPAAGVIAPVLAEAAGVPHTSPRLVVMPDDPALGEFRKTFANLIGTLEEFPLPAGGGNPGIGGQVVAPEQREGDVADLEEGDGLLAAGRLLPAEGSIEGPAARQVTDAEGHEADGLPHRGLNSWIFGTERCGPWPGLCRAA